MNIANILENASAKGQRALTEDQAKAVLKTYGVPVVTERLAKTPRAAAEAAEAIGFPVVLKGLGAKLMHKTEQGLVHLDLRDPAAVLEAAEAVERSAGDELSGFLIQPWIQGSREFMAGLFRDPQFGPGVMFGLGGTLTEALSDVTFRLAPIEERDAEQMVAEIRSQRLLGPFRGEAPVDQKGLIAALTGLSRLGAEYPRIAEIDINPLRVSPQGEVWAVDALIVLGQAPAEKALPPAVDPYRLGKFFHPRSIAFVGASSQLGKWGQNLMSITVSSGYEGKVFLVNPKGGEIAGRPVYPSVAEIPEDLDLAVVTIPAAKVPALIPEFKQKGIQNMLLITSGFAETGQEGRQMEEALTEQAREADILLLGPNTMGICNPLIRLYCTGSHVWPRAGSTSVVAQSGNMGTQLLAFAEQQGIGIRCFAGSGNEAMITIEDYLDGFEKDAMTRIGMLYVESVKNGRRFFESARRISKKKPLILMKGGRSQAGHKAAASHTGALASDSRLFDAVCRQAGIVKVEHPMDLLDLCAAFSSLPLPRGNRVAIMTLGGGWGVVTADLCAEYGLDVPELSPPIISRLDEILPPYWSRSNPVDIVGENDEKLPPIILEELLKWDGCDAVVNLGIMGRSSLIGRLLDSTLKADPHYSAQYMDQLKAHILAFEKRYVELIVELMEKYKKPVVGVSIFLDRNDQTLYRVPDKQLKGVFYQTPERAIKVLSKMREYHRFVQG